MGRNKKRKSVMEREELNNADIDVRKRKAHLKQTKATIKKKKAAIVQKLKKLEKAKAALEQKYQMELKKLDREIETENGQQ